MVIKNKFYILVILALVNGCVGSGDGLSQSTNDTKSVDKITYLKQLAKGGDLDSMYNLGHLYYVDKDYQKALEWFKLAAEQGDTKAQDGLGHLYYNGWGVKKDYQKALEWYKLAAEQGDEYAQYYLGLMYVNGEGVK